jgi:diacylglycerol kinase family enzyme
MVREALDAGANEVVAAGGDGTVSGVAEAVAGTGVAMGIVPTGTANMVARELGLPLSIAAATRAICRRERIVGMDAMASGDRSFIYQVVVGMGADINRLVSRSEKELLGRSSYLVAMLRALSEHRPLRARCRIDGREIEMWVNQLVIANAGILGTSPLRLGPGIRPDDGKVEVVAMRGKGRLDYLGSGMDMVFGNYQGHGLRYFDARREVVLETEPSTVIKADGEFIGKTPLTVRVRPGAVKVIVPAAPVRWP